MVAFMGYLRPSELTDLRVEQLVEPSKSAGTKAWSILLAPSEENIGSKTRTFDESCMLGWAEIEFMTWRLRALKAKDRGCRLWSFDYKTYSDLFTTMCEAAGVSCLSPHPYSLRHGGASLDALMKRRDTGGIKKQGRWHSDASVTRYDKHARVLAEAAKLPQAVVDYGTLVQGHLKAVLLGKRSRE